MALKTGMHFSEIAKLAWENIDLSNLIIIINDSKSGEVSKTSLPDKSHLKGLAGAVLLQAVGKGEVVIHIIALEYI